MFCCLMSSLFFFFNDTATTEIYTLSLHDALPISPSLYLALNIPHERKAREKRMPGTMIDTVPTADQIATAWQRSEEHTSELQSRRDLVCRLLLEKKKKKIQDNS